MPRTLFQPKNDEPMDDRPICFKAKKGVRDNLMQVPNWQEELREFVDQLIAGQTGSSE